MVAGERVIETVAFGTMTHQPCGDAMLDTRIPLVDHRFDELLPVRFGESHAGFGDAECGAGGERSR